MTEESTVIEVPYEIMAQMPLVLRQSMCKQMQRWFGVEAEPEDLATLNFRVHVDENTPPEWMLFFHALNSGRWTNVELALEQLRKVRTATVQKRTVSATLSLPGSG